MSVYVTGSIDNDIQKVRRARNKGVIYWMRRGVSERGITDGYRGVIGWMGLGVSGGVKEWYSNGAAMWVTG